MSNRQPEAAGEPPQRHRLQDMLPEPVDDVLSITPFAGAGEEGFPAASLSYRCYEHRGERCAWTRGPDAGGRHHGLLIRMTLNGWVVVADEEFPDEESARAWAARLWALGQGVATEDQG